MYFFQKILFLILVPFPVRNVAVFPGARNITVNWTEPENIFGVLESYLVIWFFFINIDNAKYLYNMLLLLQTMCTVSTTTNINFIPGSAAVIENQRRLQS